MSELTRRSWDAVYALPVMEFLMLICYNADKQAEVARQYREQLK